MAKIKGFYNIIETIKTALEAEPFTNTVSYGNVDEIDLNKQTIFPLAHVVVNNCVISKNTLTANISILAMDIVDESKDATTDLYVGNDNEQDVLNTQLSLLNRIIAKMQRGDLFSQADGASGNMFQIEGDVTCEPFVDRFENRLAGWAATFDVVTINDMTIC